jgi:hypothetical protein
MINDSKIKMMYNKWFSIQNNDIEEVMECSEFFSGKAIAIVYEKKELKLI